MKTMHDFTIYCTPDQMKKALVFGAPLMTFGYPDLGECKEELLKMNRQAELSTTDDGGIIVGQIPTAEQMIGWLRREKGIFVSVEPSEDWYYGTYRLQKESGFWTYGEFVDGYFETPEEATLAAIDAALDYLIKNKK